MTGSIWNNYTKPIEIGVPHNAKPPLPLSLSLTLDFVQNVFRPPTGAHGIQPWCAARFWGNRVGNLLMDPVSKDCVGLCLLYLPLSTSLRGFLKRCYPMVLPNHQEFDRLSIEILWFWAFGVLPF